MTKERAGQGDFLVGDILIAVELREYWVYLEFSDWRVDIGSDFVPRKGEDALCTINPKTGSGEINALWEVCGEQVAKCDWGDIPTFTFESGLSLSIFETGLPRGTISSKHKSIFDDF